MFDSKRTTRHGSSQGQKLENRPPPPGQSFLGNAERWVRITVVTTTYQSERLGSPQIKAPSRGRFFCHEGFT
jgi:hypothetical protein